MYSNHKQTKPNPNITKHIDKPHNVQESHVVVDALSLCIYLPVCRQRNYSYQQ